MTIVNKLVQVVGIVDAAEADTITEEEADRLGFALRRGPAGPVFLGETLRPLQLLGAAAVIGAVALAQPRTRQNHTSTGVVGPGHQLGQAGRRS